MCAPLFCRDAANETTGHEDGSACPLNGPGVPGEAFTERNLIFLCSSVPKDYFILQNHADLFADNYGNRVKEAGLRGRCMFHEVLSFC